MSRRVTILLVEDDKDMRDGTAEWLETVPERYQMEVMKASHGKMALEMMSYRTPDLIVSDIMMPEMGGYEFLHEVRKNSEWVNIPFVFVSAKGKEGDIRKGQLSDADLYVTKPFKTMELAELLQTQLDRTFARQKIRVETLESLKKNMLQILNHEFRTPLTYVTAYYDMLESNLNGRDYNEYLRGIQAGCLRLTLLVSDLIMIVELRSGEAETKFKERVAVFDDISSILLAAINEKKGFAQEHQVQMSYIPSVASGPVFADPIVLQAVFERILDNAIKFSRLTEADRRQITITTAVRDNHLFIKFRDNGLGIPEDKHQRIFDLFYQHNRDLMEQQGAGIGLTIVKEYIAMHRGYIEVESEVDVGTTFTVVLPLYNEGRFNVTSNFRPLTDRQKATLLLVEDDENLLYGLVDLLQLYEGKYELEVMTAMNGEEGLAVMAETTPDLIISDIMMPKMDGYQFLEKVRRNSDWLDIPFIFLTAKGEKRDKFEGYRMGVEMYITKPYESDDVLLLIEKHLDKHFHSQQRLIDDFEDLKRKIVSLISPEFMQPLTAVSKNADRLSEGLELIATEDELTASLREIQGGGIRLNQLIEDFISLAELETGEAEAAYRWQAQPIANLGFLIFEMCQVFSQQYSEKNVDIQCPFNDQVPLIFGDSSLLSTCIERLVDFCVVHGTATTKVIELFVNEGEDEVQIAISSSSRLQPGCEPVLSSVLISETINLTDLPDYASGLFLVKGYVALHNGCLKYQTQPDDGIVFQISLPVYKQPPEKQS